MCEHFIINVEENNIFACVRHRYPTWCSLVFENWFSAGGDALSIAEFKEWKGVQRSSRFFTTGL